MLKLFSSKYSKLFLIIFIILIIIGGVFFYQNKRKQEKQQQAQQQNKPQEKNYYEINDETIGVVFRISKRFERMSSTELQAMNSGFLYGFSIKEDPNVKCYVSQTKRSEGGQISLAALRDGVFGQIKKNKEDANLDEAKIVEIGENNKGANLKMNYLDPNQNNAAIVQWEVAGITDKAATFAFCSCPKAVIELYQDDFNLFLDSVKIK